MHNAAITRWFRALAALAALVSVVGLAGCGLPQLVSPPGRGWLLVSAQDHHNQRWQGVVQGVPGAGPDSLALIDLRGPSPRLQASLAVPVSGLGPAAAVAVSPNEALALVLSFERPVAHQRHTPDNRLSVVDLQARPPRLLKTVFVGQGPSSVAIHPGGRLALVSNHAEGTLSILRIHGQAVDALAKLPLGGAESGPAQVVISDDGRSAYVSRQGDHRISVLAIDGETVRDTGRTLAAGMRPQALVLCRGSGIGVVANQGLDQGDQDTVSVFDTRAQPPRVVDTLTVGQRPEALACSADGRHVALSLAAGSHRAPGTPFWRAHGQVQLFAVAQQRLRLVAQVDVGAEPRGLLFHPDGQHLLVQLAQARSLAVLRLGRGGVQDTGQRLPLSGAPAAMALASP